MGGSFSGTARSEYKTLLQSNHESRFKGMYRSLEELLEILNKFIWSEKMYRAQVEEFWEETRVLVQDEGQESHMAEAGPS